MRAIDASPRLFGISLDALATVLLRDLALLPPASDFAQGNAGRSRAFVKLPRGRRRRSFKGSAAAKRATRRGGNAARAKLATCRP